MTIELGSIKSYNPDRGFGFVSCTFCSPNKEVFFHIKKIKSKYPELAQKLDNGKAFEAVNFWYATNATEKGKQVGELWLSTSDISQSYAHELRDLIQKVESIWRNIDAPKPNWLNLVTIDLSGAGRCHELSIERDALKSQLRATEAQRRAAEVLRANEIGRIAETYRLMKSEADELYQLLTEMRPLNFTHGDQLSSYIRKHQLGDRYPTISGIVRMREKDREWNLHGGFPPLIYKLVCMELGLGNKGTQARPVGFTPFKQVNTQNINLPTS